MALTQRAILSLSSIDEVFIQGCPMALTQRSILSLLAPLGGIRWSMLMDMRHVMWRQIDYDGNPRFEGKNVTSAYPLLHIVKAATDRFRNEGPRLL